MQEKSIETFKKLHKKFKDNIDIIIKTQLNVANVPNVDKGQ